MHTYAVRISIGVAVVAALAIGALLMLDRSDGAVQAAPPTRDGGAVPQGSSSDAGFQCVAFGVTRLAEDGFLDIYTCQSDLATDNICGPTDTESVACSDGTFRSACTQVTGEAQWECEDTAGGSHFCAFLDGFNCESTSGGRDFIDCFHLGLEFPFSCGTTGGPLVCLPLFIFDDPPGVACAVLQGDFFAETQGDLDCDGTISSRDNQALLRNVLGSTPLSQENGCVNLGDPYFKLPARVY